MEVNIYFIKQPVHHKDYASVSGHYADFCFLECLAFRKVLFPLKACFCPSLDFPCHRDPGGLKPVCLLPLGCPAARGCFCFTFCGFLCCLVFLCCWLSFPWRCWGVPLCGCLWPPGCEAFLCFIVVLGPVCSWLWSRTECVYLLFFLGVVDWLSLRFLFVLCGNKSRKSGAQ